MRKFLRKRLLFKKQEIDSSTGYYGIEDPFPDLISKLRRFRGDTELKLQIITLVYFFIVAESLFITALVSLEVIPPVESSAAHPPWL